jgi:ribose transport system substrate-binding protein
MYFARKSAAIFTALVLAGCSATAPTASPSVGAGGGSTPGASSAPSVGASNAPSAGASLGVANPSQATTKTIGVIFGTFDSPFFVVIEAEIHSGAAQFNLKALPTQSTEFDVTKEATFVRNFIAEKVDGVILNPADSGAVVSSLNALQTANIPVVTFDTLPISGKDYMSVRTDNITMGANACKQLGTLVHSTGKVAEVQGDLANSGGFERAKGFEDCMAQNYPNVTILKIPAHWDPTQAAQGLDAVLTANPDLAGIYEHTGGGYLPSVEQVLKAHKRWVPEGQVGHMPLVSIDGEPIELQAIRDGYLDSTESQPADLYGKWSVYYMNAALNGLTFSAGPTDHGSTILQQPGGILEDSFPGIEVTKANVDDPNLWGNAQSSPAPSQ